jgi:hypothetical protein
MAFLIDVQELKPGLIIFRRADVKHHRLVQRHAGYRSGIEGSHRPQRHHSQ